MQTFDQSAQFYDAVYAARGKSYQEESRRVHELLTAKGQLPGASLLDVACGSGEHLKYLEPHYWVAGLDVSPAMLAVARAKPPRVPFFRADMASFSLGMTFDVVLSLFAAVGYVSDEASLQSTIQCMAQHLRPGGLVVIEPALRPEQVSPPETTTEIVETTIDGEPVRITRTTSAVREPAVLRIRFDYEVTAPGSEPRSFVENHPICLFSDEQYRTAFDKAGLEVEHDPRVIGALGVYLGHGP